tara:strand:- start:1532 stop:2734 length:1203 start_codon:yes stop_codon:yes gene_type:complete
MGVKQVIVRSRKIDKAVTEQLNVFNDASAAASSHHMMNTTESHSFQTTQDTGDGVNYEGQTTPAMQSVGLTIDRASYTQNIVTDDESLNGTKVNGVTIIGDSFVDCDFNSFRYGKDLKELIQFVCCDMVPHLTINAYAIFDRFGRIVNTYEPYNFGHNSKFKSFDDYTQEFIPFVDYPGRLNPVEYVRNGNYFDSYPVVNNQRRSIDHYLNPDSISLDGAIEVFEIRGQRANTNVSDMQIKGIRASLSTGDWDLPSYTVSEKKGCALVDTKKEIRQGENDWFEDAQDLVFSTAITGSVISIVGGGELDARKKYSLPGYVSDGKYLISSFRDDHRPNFKDYDHMTDLQKMSNLTGSNRNVSEIGERFKSQQNGFIMTPFYKNTEQKSFGVDSIAFSGLLKG